jgi:hypothetical protein
MWLRNKESRPPQAAEGHGPATRAPLSIRGPKGGSRATPAFRNDNFRGDGAFV